MWQGLNLLNVGFVGGLGVAMTSTASLQSVSFGFTNSLQTWTVPPNVFSVTGRLWGPPGFGYGVGAPAGTGHYVSMGFDTTPGNVLFIVVSSTDVGTSFGSGYSAVVNPGIILVAGGGGDVAQKVVSSVVSYTAGGNAGQTGSAGVTNVTANGGQGGGSGAGGAGGAGLSPGTAGSLYQFGVGGSAGIDPNSTQGGNGGGGFYGGGGGGANNIQAGGGGGGSSFASGGYNILITGSGINWNADPFWNGIAGVPAVGNVSGQVVLTYWG